MKAEMTEQPIDVPALESEQEFLRDWLRFIEYPLGQSCCGKSQPCCGRPNNDMATLSDVVDSMNERLNKVEAALASCAALGLVGCSAEGRWKRAFEVQRSAAMRAHAICYETMLAHPGVAELGDDGRLHDAIHDILRAEAT